MFSRQTNLLSLSFSPSFSLPLIVADSPFGEIQEKVLTDTSRRKSWGKVHKANNYLPLIIHLINIVRLSHKPVVKAIIIVALYSAH